MSTITKQQIMFANELANEFTYAVEELQIDFKVLKSMLDKAQKCLYEEKMKEFNKIIELLPENLRVLMLERVCAR